LLAPKAIIKNEYGILMGKLEEEKPGAKKGYAEIDGKKYYYVFENNTVELYDETGKKSIAICSFNALPVPVEKSKSFLDTRLPQLLMVLCWYTLHNPATRLN
jgi:hypothetical protein